MSGTIACGNATTCVCTDRCEMPCWQRVGLTSKPCCVGCAPLAEVEDALTATTPRPSLRKLHPPYRDTFELRLDVEHVEALRDLLRWFAPEDDFPGGRRDWALSLDSLIEVQEALRDG